jgi:hypothetical protein
VLTDLPDKISSVERVPMSARQQELYFQLVRTYKDRAAKVRVAGRMWENLIFPLLQLAQGIKVDQLP